jgi:hypothetical protein
VCLRLLQSISDNYGRVCFLAFCGNALVGYEPDGDGTGFGRQCRQMEGLVIDGPTPQQHWFPKGAVDGTEKLPVFNLVGCVTVKGCCCYVEAWDMRL